ncbi:MAG TPA: glycosyltransferase [Acidimicrobiales bacterium]|nr:glycosyltransferase [Acidimicrobiales bacterium]
MVESAYSEDAARRGLSTGSTATHALHVLLVDVSDRGGIARYTDCLASALRSEGVTVSLAAPSGRADPGLGLAHRKWGPELSGMARQRLRARRLAEIVPSAILLGRAVVRARPDVVHMQTEVVPPFDDLAVRAVSRRVPVVITAHDPEPLDGGERALERQARRWRSADAVIIHGDGPRDLVERHAAGVPVHVVPVDLPLGGPAASRDEARRGLGLDDAPTALLLGLLRPYKGIDLLAEAWPAVVARVPRARLLLVGEPYACAEMDRLVQVGGVELRAGFIAEDDLNRWAAAADVMVLPYHRGSHSGILHRALAVGTPVLASPSLADEVGRTGAGRVVEMDGAAWADALVAALVGPASPAPPVPTGRSTALGTLAVYREVLQRRAQRHRTGGHHAGGHHALRRHAGGHRASRPGAGVLQ